MLDRFSVGILDRTNQSIVNTNVGAGL